MSPEHYAEEFSRYRSYVGTYSGTRVEAIACGQNGNDWAWTTRFFEHLSNRNYKNRLRGMQGYAVHYYCQTAGTATQYTNEQWLELLAKAYAIEGILIGARGIMDQYDPERRLKLIFDEWGTWHPVEEGKPTGGLYQQNTVRDACVAALTLDVFQNHADEIFMANIAQLINVLQALLLVEEDRCIKTPTYHVFDLYRPHQGAQAVRTLFDAPEVAFPADVEEHHLFGLAGSASLRGETLTLTVVNPRIGEPVEATINLRGYATIREASETMLTHADIRAHNTFDAPDTVTPAPPRALAASGRSFRHMFGPQSVTSLTLALA
jgi:alpha-N-arabinofuranosidase